MREHCFSVQRLAKAISHLSMYITEILSWVHLPELKLKQQIWDTKPILADSLPLGWRGKLCPFVFTPDPRTQILLWPLDDHPHPPLSSSAKPRLPHSCFLYRNISAGALALIGAATSIKAGVEGQEVESVSRGEKTLHSKRLSEQASFTSTFTHSLTHARTHKWPLFWHG